MAHIHSKPVVYVNNGGGRDTYISDMSGGLRVQYAPAHGKRTFYNNLRQYDQRMYGFGKRDQSHTATMQEKRDIYSKSQNHFNPKFNREMNLVRNYQMMMDKRLSCPKETQLEVREGKRVFRNSKAEEQEPHQKSFYRTSGNWENQDQLRESARSLSPVVDQCRSFAMNLHSYTNIKKTTNTIDKTNL